MQLSALLFYIWNIVGENGSAQREQLTFDRKTDTSRHMRLESHVQDLNSQIKYIHAGDTDSAKCMHAVLFS